MAQAVGSRWVALGVMPYVGVGFQGLESDREQVANTVMACTQMLM